MTGKSGWRFDDLVLLHFVFSFKKGAATAVCFIFLRLRTSNTSSCLNYGNKNLPMKWFQLIKLCSDFKFAARSFNRRSFLKNVLQYFVLYNYMSGLLFLFFN